MDKEEFAANKGKNKKYPRPVYFSSEETQLIKVAALMNGVSINTFIHDCVIEEIKKRLEEYQEVCQKIKGKDNIE